MKKLAGILVICLITFACKKEKTIWETDWSAPIINDTLDLKNLVNDTTISVVGGFYELDLERTLFDLNIFDLIDGKIDTTITEEFTFSGSLNLAPGFNFVNSVDEHFLNIDDIQLKKVILKEGFIDISVENPLPTTTIFNVVLPGVSLAGSFFNDQYSAPPSSGGNPGVTSETIDLSGYEIDLTGVSGGGYNLLRSQITVATDPTGPQVTLTSSDVTKIFASFRDVKLDYARGYFGPLFLSDTTVEFLEVLNSLQTGTVDFPSSSITFEIENGGKVGAEGLLTTVSNINNDMTTVNLSHSQIGSSFNIDPATGSWSTLTPSFKTINFNSSNSNIEAYLENLGALHTLGYSMQLNPWGNVSGGWDELFPNSNLRVKMKANMPLNISLDNLVLRDTFDVKLNQEPNKTRIKSGEIIVQASNGFPISGGLKLFLLNENGAVMHTITGTSTLKSSEYGTFNSNYNFNVCGSELRFILSDEDLVDINDVRSLIVQSTFNTPNPATSINEQMSIPEGAFLAIKVKTKFKTENIF